MKRVFKVTLSKALYPNDTSAYEVVADTAEIAIGKAKRAAIRETLWRGAWVVEEVYHRGPAT